MCDRSDSALLVESLGSPMLGPIQCGSYLRTSRMRTRPLLAKMRLVFEMLCGELQMLPVPKRIPKGPRGADVSHSVPQGREMYDKGHILKLSKQKDPTKDTAPCSVSGEIMGKWGIYFRISLIVWNPAGVIYFNFSELSERL